ncbi:MAG: helix-turn-helix transcriptional regulator [Planctomycetaceae bacterium]
MADRPIPEQAQKPTARLLTVLEVARMLGMSTRSVWRLAKQNRCPLPLKLGRSTRWRTAEIEIWIEQGCPRTPDDVERKTTRSETLRTGR